MGSSSTEYRAMDRDGTVWGALPDDAPYDQREGGFRVDDGIVLTMTAPDGAPTRLLYETDETPDDLAEAGVTPVRI